MSDKGAARHGILLLNHFREELLQECGKDPSLPNGVNWRGETIGLCVSAAFPIAARVYAQERGHGIRPAKHAVRVDRKEID